MGKFDDPDECTDTRRFALRLLECQRRILWHPVLVITIYRQLDIEVFLGYSGRAAHIRAEPTVVKYEGPVDGTQSAALPRRCDAQTLPETSFEQFITDGRSFAIHGPAMQSNVLSQSDT